jgi:hypothetical protein
MICVAAAAIGVSFATMPCSDVPGDPERVTGVGHVAPATGVDARVTALLAALTAYERSFDGVWWRQTTYAPPSANRNIPTWRFLEESERAIGLDWRFLHHTRHSIAERPDWKQSSFRAVYFGDNTRRVTAGLDPDDTQGMLTQPDFFFAGGCNIWRLLGHFTEYADPMRSRSLAEELVRASDLEYLAPVDDQPWPGVRARGGVSGGAMDAEVRLDPAHGFAPRVILLFRRLDGALVEALVTLEYQQVDGVWIPSVGLQGCRYVEQVDDVDHAVTPERRADFDRAATMEGLPEPVRTPALRSWIERLQRVEVLDRTNSLATGPFVWYQPKTSVHSPQVMIVTEVKVNAFPDHDNLFRRLPPRTRMFNGMAGQWATVDEVRRFVEDLESAVTPGDPGDPQ